jgi:hypothetical protein
VQKCTAGTKLFTSDRGGHLVLVYFRFFPLFYDLVGFSPPWWISHKQELFKSLDLTDFCFLSGIDLHDRGSQLWNMILKQNLAESLDLTNFCFLAGFGFIYVTLHNCITI